MGQIARGYSPRFSYSWLGLLLQLLLCSSTSTGTNEIPTFTKLSPSLVEFSNSSGATIQCQTDQSGVKIQWLLKDGNLVTDVTDLRKLDGEGNLLFLPFSAQLFRQDVHAAVYKCSATNTLGTVLSHDIQVKAVVLQPYDVYVYDVYAMTGNTAVMRCHIPSFLTAFVNVTAWIRDSVVVIKTAEVDQNSKYTLMPSGELFVKDVDMKDSATSFQCQTQNRLTGETLKSSTSGKLFITEPQGNVPPKLILSTKKIIAHQGRQVFMPCEAQANPPAEISWQKLETKEQLTKIFSKRQSQISGSLIINNVMISDSGIFRCTASNSVGQDYVDIDLIVIDHLTIEEEFRSVVVDVGKRTSFSCKSSQIHSMAWFKNGNLVTPTKQVVLNNNNSTIHILSMSPNDKGIYQCCIENEFEKVCGSIAVLLGDQPPEINEKFNSMVKQPGENIKLKCNAKGNPKPKILWFLDDNPLTVKGRFNIKIDDQINTDVSSELFIENTETEDGGLYKCTAENYAGYAFHWDRINVFGDVGIRSRPPLSIVNGETAVLNCPVYGYPIQDITWEKDNVILPNELRQMQTINDSLIIQNVNRARDSGLYICTVRGSEGSQLKQGRIQLNVMIMPRLSAFSFQDELVQEGSRGRLQCVVVEGDIPLKIEWYKDGKSLPSNLGITVRDIDEFSSILNIASITPRHNGKYTCKASNAAGTVSFSTQLAVNVPPKWISEPLSQTIKTGETVYFHCKADGYPDPIVTWTFTKGLKVAARHQISNDVNTKILKNGTLILSDITKDKEGRYICSASNTVGIDLSTTALLTILAPPSFNFSDQKLNVRIGEKITINCTPTGDAPIAITWFHNNYLIKESTESRFRINKQNISSNLTILELTRKDSSTFACEAKNKYGSSKINYNVQVQEPPEAPEIDLNPAKGNRSVFISWEKPFDGNSQITHYAIQYKKQVDNWLLKKMNETVDYSKTAVKITNLQPATPYSFRVAAINAIGSSKFSSEVTQSTDTDVPTGEVQKVEIEAIDGNSLRITWKPPRKDTWNGPIRGYNIGYRVDGSNDPYEFSALEVPEDYSEDLIYQLSNLQKYTMYRVVIQVYNDKGVGPLIDPILVMTSEDVPTVAPEGLRCSTLSSKSIYILWDTLPSDYTNGILRGYKVFYKPVTEWYDPQIQFKISDKEKLTLHNLEVNTNYSITVLGFTKIGDGIKSDPVYCKTHEDVPDRPQEIKALSSSLDSVVLAWKPPKRSNGEMMKYNIYYRPMSESEEVSRDAILKTEQIKNSNVQTFQSDVEYFEIKGLRKNQKYVFWVAATSPIGEGQFSDVVAQTVTDSTVAAASASFDDMIETPWKKDIMLACRAVGIPAPQRKWSIGREPVSIGGRKILLSDGTLLINKAENGDSGNYTCSIYNIYGKDQIQYSLNVQVPPAAPMFDIISKTRSSIQLQWKPGPSGGDPIKGCKRISVHAINFKWLFPGYTLYYRKDISDWQKVELGTDKEIFTLDNLACGANYEIFMEAYNKIGKGLPSDTIKTSTDGSEISIPSTNQLLHEGSTFVSVHLDVWPKTACPVKNFKVEYKTLFGDEWTTVSSSIRPTQRKLVIPGLATATWYTLRVTANTDGDAVPAEYKFATRTATGATIPPPEIKMEPPQSPVYIFYLDPYIFIPAVALLIVVIIASAVICVWIKRKNGSVGTPDYDTWQGSGIGSNYTASTMYATIPHHRRKRSGDPNHATGHVEDCFLDSDGWIESRTLTRGNPRDHVSPDVRFIPQRMTESMQQNMRMAPNFQETSFAFEQGPPGDVKHGDYDQPPKGM